MAKIDTGFENVMEEVLIVGKLPSIPGVSIKCSTGAPGRQKGEPE